MAPTSGTRPPQSPVSAQTCVAASVNSPMLGTADPVDGWLLLEAPGRWGAQWRDAADLDPAFVAQVELLLASAAAGGFKLRPQLIKQSRVQGQRVLLIVDGRLSVLAGGRGALAALQPDRFPALLSAARSGQPVDNPDASLQALSEPQYFVCTNGQRDRCCGALGLPIYRLLAEQVQQRCWQISHVGGHRFAPNVLVTPGALLYGRLDPATVPQFLQDVEASRVAFAWLRGRSTYAPVVQAAELLLQRQGLRLLHVADQGSAVRVTFCDEAETVAITVGRSVEEELVLASCGAAELKPYSPFAARSN